MAASTLTPEISMRVGEAHSTLYSPNQKPPSAFKLIVFLAIFNGIVLFSTGTIWKLSKILKTIIFVSNNANLEPIQPRGPKPKGFLHLFPQSVLDVWIHRQFVPHEAHKGRYSIESSEKEDHSLRCDHLIGYF
ncbi:hypothetical protein NQ317_013397 [Molorchus minor]|uniref:Uncharacterized protein n=1 Tax=Molorchus minor TaxID=1323400 RepID=A0ABQ9J6Y9_9CUCU|nr:hypothetical protein NQ317_013397 [Molorchus minor]